MLLNIPNVLTLLRIVLIPVFVVCYYLPVAWSSLAAASIFFLAGVTDWFDGYLARKLQQTSAFGAFLDPVADKIMVATALIVLLDKNTVNVDGVFMVIPAVIIIGREITISALREWMAEVGSRNSVAVSIIGKVKTMAQMSALCFLLLGEPLFGIDIVMLGFFLLYVATLLTLWSMIAYLHLAWPELTEK